MNQDEIKLLSNEMAELAIQYNYSHKIFKNNKKSHKHMSKFYVFLIEKALKKGCIETFYMKDKLYAFFIRINFKHPMNEQIVNSINTSYRLRSPKAKKWWIRIVKRELQKCPRGTNLHVGPKFLKHKKLFNKFGFHMDAVQILGDVKKSLRIIESKDLKTHKNITIRKLTNPKWALPIAKVVIKEFKKRPWHCRFAAYDSCQKHFAKRYRDYANNRNSKEHKDTSCWVVLKDNKPLGIFSTVIREDGLMGKVAGLDFGFDESLQGKGIGLLAYREIFRWLDKKKVKPYQGFTSNPAVLHMARVLDRETINWHFRKGNPHYSETHFNI
ncbi:MAG: GNAT family N-acetyltransferase [Bacteriovoracaceae bacterium]|nr:GNAT family N-acetyltransferase [Bacteriovoracaceae bacterium]